MVVMVVVVVDVVHNKQNFSANLFITYTHHEYLVSNSYTAFKERNQVSSKADSRSSFFFFAP